MLCLTCTMISSVDPAQYGVSRAKDWVSVDCVTSIVIFCITMLLHIPVAICLTVLH